MVPRKATGSHKDDGGYRDQVMAARVPTRAPKATKEKSGRSRPVPEEGDRPDLLAGRSERVERVGWSSLGPQEGPTEQHEAAQQGRQDDAQIGLPAQHGSQGGDHGPKAHSKPVTPKATVVFQPATGWRLPRTGRRKGPGCSREQWPARRPKARVAPKGRVTAKAIAPAMKCPRCHTKFPAGRARSLRADRWRPVAGRSVNRSQEIKPGLEEKKSKGAPETVRANFGDTSARRP